MAKLATDDVSNVAVWRRYHVSKFFGTEVTDSDEDAKESVPLLDDAVNGRDAILKARTVPYNVFTRT